MDTWALNPHLKNTHALVHVKILFNKRGGLRKQMTVAVSIAVFGYNNHKLFVFEDIVPNTMMPLDLEP